jgi:hypothetical protein
MDVGIGAMPQLVVGRACPHADAEGAVDLHVDRRHGGHGQQEVDLCEDAGLLGVKVWASGLSSPVPTMQVVFSWSMPGLATATPGSNPINISPAHRAIAPRFMVPRPPRLS